MNQAEVDRASNEIKKHFIKLMNGRTFTMAMMDKTFLSDVVHYETEILQAVKRNGLTAPTVSEMLEVKE